MEKCIYFFCLEYQRILVDKKMKLSLKIVLAWAIIILLYLLSIKIFSSTTIPISGYINQSIQTLLFVISIFILFKEPNKKNKYIFLNFTIYFSLSFLSFLYNFVGKSILTDEKYSRHLFFQYLSIAYILILSIAVLYLVIDLIFRDYKIYQKYIASIIIVLGFVGYFYYPILNNPLYLYSTEDIKQFKTIDAYVSTNKEISNPVELANRVTLQSWKNGNAVGDLYPEENLRRIEWLFQYLEGDNYKILLWKPIYINCMMMDALLVGFILLFFGYQYKKDPPQGAYVDKIMFLILLLQSMDILHNWGFIKSVEYGSFTELFIVGQYITIFAELMMILFFSLRLRFITSVQGEFYETELAANPHQISRWRDWVDNLVLSQFFNYKVFNGRLFQKSTGK